MITSTSIEDMKGLGYLEETILLLVMLMEEPAYGFSVSEAYQKHMGKTISISVRNFAARVSLQAHPELRIDSHVDDQARYPGIDALYEHVDLHGY